MTGSPKLTLLGKLKFKFATVSAFLLKCGTRCLVLPALRSCNCPGTFRLTTSSKPLKSLGTSLLVLHIRHLSRQPLRYTALGTGCAPLLQCLGRLSFLPSVGWYKGLANAKRPCNCRVLCLRLKSSLCSCAHSISDMTSFSCRNQGRDSVCPML